jgi:hypothetical protein
MDWNLVNIHGQISKPEQGSRQVFEFSDAPMSEKKLFFHNSLLLIGQCSRPLIAVGWTNLQILRRHIRPVANSMVLLHNVDAHNVNVTGRVCFLTWLHTK